MSPATLTVWLLALCLVCGLITCAMYAVVADQRDEIRDLREDLAAAADAAAGAASDRERLTGALVEENRLLTDLHEVARQRDDLADQLNEAQCLIETFIDGSTRDFS